ncbi:hypothetical protein [Burkholderia pseudomallei]|uniref:hypothetical protein n=1 Tax=Burkholderia pseudomallei TaxID=28450 RepID=UPI0012F526F6|nr:hypothetical protein [Burkholderia pseudomallei]
MKIAGWEVTQELIDAVSAKLRGRQFDAEFVRAVARETGLLPGVEDCIDVRYVREEIGTRLIDYFKRTKQIEKVPRTRKWRWAFDSLVARATDTGGEA